MDFKEIRSAYRRANHFCKEKPDCPDLPSTINYCFMLNGARDSFETICIFHEWARSLNRTVDQCRVKDSPELIRGLYEFKHRLFFNPEKLQ